MILSVVKDVQHYSVVSLPCVFLHDVSAGGVTSRRLTACSHPSFEFFAWLRAARLCIAFQPLVQTTID
jgi:hypothetical protein